MDTASRSNKGFADDNDDDEDEFGKETSSFHRDGEKNKSDDIEQKPSTPRSKHSATEQRRRSRINERFRILRDLIPHSDQKRDKASFLLEVIEYIQFLQEKVQKYEVLNPGWNPDSEKLMPWRTNHARGESVVDPSHVKDSPASTGFIFPADGAISGVPMAMSNSQNVMDIENLRSSLANKSSSLSVPVQYSSVGADTGVSLPQQRLLSDLENMAAQPQAGWPRSTATDGSVGCDILTGQEALFIDEGTISFSSMYSDRLLTTLTQALQSSGIDLSQAGISVQINLARGTICRPTFGTKDQDDPTSSNHVVGHSRVTSGGRESEDANKRPRSDTS